MPILTNSPADDARRRAQQLRTLTQSMATSLSSQWQAAAALLWDAKDPQAVLDEFGTDAAELINLSGALVQFLGQLLPGQMDEEWQRIADRIATIPAYTKNEDGTITLDPQES